MHPQAARLERRDHRVVVGGVAGQHVGAHRAGGRPSPAASAGAGRSAASVVDALGQVGVVEADLGVLDRRRRRRRRASRCGRRSVGRGSAIIASTLSSEPASQYCMHRNQARRSCALPGMKRRMRGSRRSIAICDWPLGEPPGVRRAAQLLHQRHRAGRGRGHVEAGRAGSASPPRRAEMQQTIASQASRRACEVGQDRRMCSSRNSMVATTMSPAATRPWRGRAPPDPRPIPRRRARSAAGRGIAAASRACTRSAGPATWASRVMITTL